MSSGGKLPKFAVIALAVVLYAPIHAQVLRRVTDLNPDGIYGWSVGDAGSVAVAVWGGDPLGTNPHPVNQIFKWVIPSGAVSQLTNFPGGVTRNVSITDDAQWIVFDSSSDPVQQNGDGTVELFRMRTDGSQITQLTNDDLLGEGRPQCPTVSGSGNRLLFYGTYDPFGTNPDHREQVFLIDLATLQLSQLTHGASVISVPYRNSSCYAAISDDGERIVFTDNEKVFKIDADGQNLTEMTQLGSAHAWGISGNGERIVSVQGPQADFGVGDIRLLSWDGTGLTFLDEGRNPTIQDDGARVFYSSSGGDIYVAVGNPPHPVQVSPPGVPGFDYQPVVSGGGDRIVFLIVVGEYPGGDNPDGGVELMAMDDAGTEFDQLTVSVRGSGLNEPDITPDGTRAVYNVLGYPGSVFALDLDGSAPMLVTVGDEIRGPTITGDGETIVFWSWYDLSGIGECTNQSSPDVFQVQVDGTELLQLTNPRNEVCFSINVQPVVTPSAGLVVFQVGAPNGIAVVPLGGGAATTIAEDSSSLYKRPSVSADGVWVTWHGLPGGSADIQIHRGRTDGTFVEILTDSEDWSVSPDISGDGRLVSYVTSADPLGTNPDNNDELFLYDAQISTTEQLTDTSGGYNRGARLSDDGELVYFTSFETELGNGLFRIHLSTGLLERSSGRMDGPGDGWEDRPPLAVDENGGRVVFLNSGNLWLSDFDTQNTIRPSAQAPTVVAWEPDPRALDYDVIRGDVADLAPGPGNTVDLGSVVCLENDTLNTNTAGAEADPDQPAPGQVFFYLYRFTQGLPTDSASYGPGLVGAERFASGGDCPQ